MVQNHKKTNKQKQLLRRLRASGQALHCSRVSEQALRHSKATGQAALLTMLFFMIIIMAIIGGMSVVALSGAKASRELMFSKKSFFAAESGLEDVFYRLSIQQPTKPPGTLDIGDAHIGIHVTEDQGISTTIVASSSLNNIIRATEAEFITKGINFPYVLQAGDGGIEITGAGNVQVTGNVYSNGNITGAGDKINGNITVAQVGNSITNISVDENPNCVYEVRADEVYGPAEIWANVFFGPANPLSCLPTVCMCPSGTTSGNSPSDTKTPPVDSSAIQVWVDNIDFSCPISSSCFYSAQTVTDGTLVLGGIDSDSFSAEDYPAHVDGNLVLNGVSDLQLAGNIYVGGDVTLNSDCAVYSVTDSTGSNVSTRHRMIIAEGTITVNGTCVVGSERGNNPGTAGYGHVVLISKKAFAANNVRVNDSAKVSAIYASHGGYASVNNNAEVNSIYGEKIFLSTNAGESMTIEDSSAAGLELNNIRLYEGSQNYNVSRWQEIQ